MNQQTRALNQELCVAKRHCVSAYLHHKTYLLLLNLINHFRQKKCGAIGNAKRLARGLSEKSINPPPRTCTTGAGRTAESVRAGLFKWMARPSDRQRMARPCRAPLPLRARLCLRRGRASAARATRSSRRPRPTGGRAAPGRGEPQTQRLWRGSYRERNAARSSRGQEHTYPTYNIQGQPQQGAGAVGGGAAKAALSTGGRRLLVRL